MSTDFLILVLFVITLTINVVAGTMYFREVAKNGRQQNPVSYQWDVELTADGRFLVHSVS